MKLVLLGGGRTKSDSFITQNLIKIFNENILLVDYANPEGYLDPKKYFEQYNTAFKQFGKNLSPFVKNHSENDVLYLAGGDTFLLKRKLIDSDLFDSLIDKHKLLIGNSAGSILMGKTIQFAHDGNRLLVKDFKGLNLLNNYIVFPHYSEANALEINSILKEHSKIILLPELGGILWDGKQVSNIGTKNIIFINNGSKIILEQGSSIAGDELEIG
jgi:peptidase E